MSILSDEQLRRHRIPLLLVACLQAFFGSGIFYGWASLYTLFLEAGVYRDLCEPDQQVCAQQKERLSFIYTGKTWHGMAWHDRPGLATAECMLC